MSSTKSENPFGRIMKIIFMILIISGSATTFNCCTNHITKNDSIFEKEKEAEKYSEDGFEYIDSHEIEIGVECLETSLKLYQNLSNDNPDEYKAEILQLLTILIVYYSDLADYEQSIKCLYEAYEIYEDLVKNLPQENSSFIAFLYLLHGKIYAHQNQFSSAREYYLKALGTYNTLGSEATSEEIGWAYHVLAELEIMDNRFNMANRRFVFGNEVFRASITKDSINNISDYALFLGDWAILKIKQNRFDSASVLLNRSIKPLMFLKQENPKEYDYWFAEMLSVRGRLHFEKNELEKAKSDFESSLEYFKAYAMKYPLRFGELYARITGEYSQVQLKIGELYTAKKILEEAMGVFPIFDEKKYDLHYYEYAKLHLNYGLVLMGLNELDKAEKSIIRAHEMFQNLSNMVPEAYNYELALSKNMMGLFFQKINDYGQSERYYKEALNIFEIYDASFPNIYSEELVETLGKLAELHREKGEWEKAENGFNEALLNCKYFNDEYPKKYNIYEARVKNGLCQLLIESGQAENDTEIKLKCEDLLKSASGLLDVYQTPFMEAEKQKNRIIELNKILAGL
jgi:tetratricopeptide (TPR) repeat protein